MLNFFVIVTFFLCCSDTLAQDTLKSSEKWKFSGGIGTSFSYQGYNLTFPVEIDFKNNVFYAGPKIHMRNTYLFYKGPYGFHTGYRRNLLNKKKITMSAVADYQVSQYRSVSATSLSPMRKNYIHEMNIGYGLVFKFNARLYIFHFIGAGFYTEKYYNADQDKRLSLSGFNNLSRISLNYTFCK